MHRIGLIGSGTIATEHASAYASVDDAEIVAIVSKEDASGFATRYAPGSELFDDVETMLDAVDPDIVDICVPTHKHREIVETTVDRGYDTFCEKPMARSLADAQRMADRIERSGVTFMVGHLLRFYPQYRRAKEVVDGGGIGEPGVANLSRVGPFPSGSWNNWFADVEESGGILLDLMIHDFDYLRWALGEVERVYTQSVQWRDGEKLMDHAVVLLRFESGAVAHVKGSWAQPERRPFEFSMDLAGDDGLVEYDHDSVPFESHTDDHRTRRAVTGASPMQREIEHFLSCVENDAAPEISVDDAIEAMRISLAAIESAERGEPVAVEEVSA